MNAIRCPKCNNPYNSVNWDKSLTCVVCREVYDNTFSYGFVPWSKPITDWFITQELLDDDVLSKYYDNEEIKKENK